MRRQRRILAVGQAAIWCGFAVGCGRAMPESNGTPAVGEQGAALCSSDFTLTGAVYLSSPLSSVYGSTGFIEQGTSQGMGGYEGATWGVSTNGPSTDGVVFDARLSDDSELFLRIDGSERGEGSNADIMYYEVSARQGNSEWSELCGQWDDGRAKRAMALPGLWVDAPKPGAEIWENSETEFTFACEGSSVAKCVELGYKPWSGEDKLQGRAMPHYHDACVRMMRADYCGDGQSWTAEGQTIGLWDRRGIQPESFPDWTFEAAWSPLGAVCLDTPRIDFPKGEVPSCLKKLQKNKCNKPSPQKLLMSSFQTQLAR